MKNVLFQTFLVVMLSFMDVQGSGYRILPDEYHDCRSHRVWRECLDSTGRPFWESDTTLSFLYDSPLTRMYSHQLALSHPFAYAAACVKSSIACGNGIFLDPWTVLTNAHVVMHVEDIEIHHLSVDDQAFHKIPASSIIVHPGYLQKRRGKRYVNREEFKLYDFSKPISNQSRFDLAIIKLSHPATGIPAFPSMLPYKKSNAYLKRLMVAVPYRLPGCYLQRITYSCHAACSIGKEGSHLIYQEVVPTRLNKYSVIADYFTSMNPSAPEIAVDMVARPWLCGLSHKGMSGSALFQGYYLQALVSMGTVRHASIKPHAGDTYKVRSETHVRVSPHIKWIQQHMGEPTPGKVKNWADTLISKSRQKRRNLETLVPSIKSMMDNPNLSLPVKRKLKEIYVRALYCYVPRKSFYSRLFKKELLRVLLELVQQRYISVDQKLDYHSDIINLCAMLGYVQSRQFQYSWSYLLEYTPTFDAHTTKSA